MLSSGGLKDFRIKPGTVGAGFIIVEFPFCRQSVLWVLTTEIALPLKKNEILLTKVKEGDVFESFLSFFEVVL